MTVEHPAQGRQTLDAVTLLRSQVKEVHRALDVSFADFLKVLAPGSPPTGSPPVAVYVHAATVEDIAIHTLLRGVEPLFATRWAGAGPSRYSTDDLAPVQRYAQDVFASTDSYMAELTPGAASLTVDLSRLELGYPTVAWVVSKFVVLELAQLCGELISAVQASRNAP
jgi:hypothetical protein